MNDHDVDVRLQKALRQALDGDLRDDARCLVSGHKLAQPLWEGQHREQPKGLEEHEAIEHQASPREAEDEEEPIEATLRPKVDFQVW